MNGIGFEPQGAYVLVQVPEEYWEKKATIVVDKATKDEMRKEYIQKGDRMIVAATGVDCAFVKPGDVVAIEIRGAMEIFIDGIADPFIVIRESNVIGKFD